MKAKPILLFAVASVVTVGIGTALVLGAENSTKSFHSGFTTIRNAKTSIDFSSETVKRRVYFLFNDNDWGADSGWRYNDIKESLYVYAWQIDDDDNKATVKANLLTADYHPWAEAVGCIHYADIEFEGAGDNIGVIVKTSSDWSGKQTVDVALPPLWDTEHGDVIYLNSGESDGKRNASVGYISGMNASVLAGILPQYKTCSDSLTDGYNAYPQIKKNFVDGNAELVTSTTFSDYDYSDYADNGYSYEGLTQTATYSIAQKLDAMKELYEENGWSPSKYSARLSFNASQSPYASTFSKGATTITFDSVTTNTYANIYGYIHFTPANAIGIKFLLTNNRNTHSIDLNTQIGTGNPFVSHLTLAPDAEGTQPYDWYDGGDKHGKYGIGESASRELSFYFDKTQTNDGILLYINSHWAGHANPENPSETILDNIVTTDGSLTISNAVFLF